MKQLLPFLAACAVVCQASLACGEVFTEFAAFQAATQSLTLENFDSAPWPGVQQDSLNGTTNFGITWDSVNELGSTEVVWRSEGTSISDFNGTPDSLDKITATVGIGGVTAFGGFVHNFFDYGQSDTITMTAFDAGNNVLGTIAATPPSNFDFLGITSVVDIARLEFASGGPTPGDDFAVDDVYFGSVPEPSTIALLVIAGLLAYAYHRRKR